MASFKEIVDSSILNVVVPNVVLDFPTKDIEHSAWLSRLRSEGIERERAFFDESLDFFLVLCLEQQQETPTDPAHPPLTLLSFLAHTQVSYDVAYISPTSVSNLSVPRLGAPPRTTSLKPTTGSGSLHVPPNIFPPNTPSPAPVTTEQDRRYVRAEGVLLVSGMWGEELDTTKPGQVKDRDAFALLWDETVGIWVAVYRMCVNVAFLRLPVRDPLLCLTVSITVREKPIPMTPARGVLLAMYKEAGGQPELPKSARWETFNHALDIDSAYNGLDEVNLLEGLSSAPTFANVPTLLSLPSTRISAKIRKRDFALPADPPSMVDAPVTTSSLATRATLRKSFRRTISAVSGFRVRMRTVFVPYVLLHPTEPDVEVDHALAAGHTERTVILCVELEHPGEAPEAFLVDAVDVTVGGGGDARVRLLPWCENLPKQMFPLHLGMHEQCNLLFAVELLNAPTHDRKALLLNASTVTMTQELQRPVTITVWGRPFSYVLSSGGQSSPKIEETNEPLFPTPPFPSRWNCVLDLAPQRLPAEGQRESEVLPEPPTPFPVITPRLPIPATDQQGQQTPVAVFGRFTLPGHVPSSPRPSLPSRVSPSPLGTGGVTPGASPLSKLAYTPPSVVAAMSGAPHTTYAPPPSAGIPPPALLSKMLPMGETDEAFMGSGGIATSPPTTPAYPAYSRNSTVPATPRTYGPLAMLGAAHAPSATIEPPRSGAPSWSSPVPSPLALMPSSSIFPQNERIIVSVGLQEDGGIGVRRLVPYDVFALEIFIFNQTESTRRFEVTFQERRRRRHGHAEGQGQWDYTTVRRGASRSGIVPLGSRVRVGPLRPDTCQSVKMAFLALLPGVHTIEAVTLTDTDTQHALTLRTSLDVVIYEAL